MHSDCIAFTGRVARLVPLPAERPAACPFNAAKLPGVSGFWLRGESLANLALLAQPCGPPLLQVHLKGRLLLECSTAPSRFAHALLTPAQTQRRWLLVARSGLSDQGVFCFQFDTEEGGSNAAAAFQAIAKAVESRSASDLPQQPMAGTASGHHPSSGQPSQSWQHTAASESFHSQQQASGPASGHRRPSPPLATPAPKRQQLLPGLPSWAATAAAMVWEQTGQLRSESNGAALTESEVAAELASVPDEELLVAMQASMADPAFLALAERVAGLWDQLTPSCRVKKQN